jgi:hypothetical protein
MTYDDHDQYVPTPGMQPDLDEVLQVENVETHLVPVKISEPVEVRELPSKRMSMRTVSVGTTAGVKVLSADPRRKTATLIPRTSDILVGASQAQAQLNGAWLPGVVPFVVSSVAEVWAVGNGATTDVSVIEEYWA